MSEEYVDETPHNAILDYIGPGSVTKKTLLEVLGDEYDEVEIKVALSDLVEQEKLVEHPEINGAWKKNDL